MIKNFVENHTGGFAELKLKTRNLDFETLEAAIRPFARVDAGICRTDSRREERRARLEHGHHAARLWRRRGFR